MDLIYAFGKMPKGSDTDLLKFIEDNDGLFVLPEAFLKTSGFSADDFARLTQDSEKIIVSGTGLYVFGDHEEAGLFSDGKSMPVAYPNSRQYMYVGGSTRIVEIRVCSDISLGYMDELFDVLLHPSSGSFIVNRYYSIHKSPEMQSKPVVSSSYARGQILVDGNNVGKAGKTPGGIEYVCLDFSEFNKIMAKYDITD